MKASHLREVYDKEFSRGLGEHLQCYNHSHGPDGRFTSSSGASSRVSAGHGSSSHRYTAKDIIGGSNVKRKQGGGRRFEKGGMLAGRTIKTKPGADPTDAVHTKGTFGDRGSVLLNQRAIAQRRTASAQKRNSRKILAEENAGMLGRARRQLRNAPNDPFARGATENAWMNAGVTPRRTARIAKTQAKAKAGAAALKAPNLNTKGGYPFAKVARFRPRGRK